MRQMVSWLIIYCALLASVGCKSDEDRLREERDVLLREKSNLQPILDQNKMPSTQLTNDQRTYYGQIDQRVQAIDLRVDQINYELAGWHVTD